MIRKALYTQEKGKNLVAVGMGFVTLDLIVIDGDRQEVSMRVGGSCGNVLTILSYLGWSTYPIANLSKGLASDLVVSDMKDQGVNVSLIRRSSNGRTPVVLEKVLREKSNNVMHNYSMKCPLCNTRFPKFKPPRLAEVPELPSNAVRPKVFYFDRAFPASLRMAEVLSNKQALVFFEPNNIGNEGYFKRALKLSHVLKCNERVYRRLVIRSNGSWPKPPITIVTRGEKGVKFSLNGGKWRTVKGYKAIVVRDTAGAGDWFSAGFLSSLFVNGGIDHNRPKKEVIQHSIDEGQKLASINCMFVGARGLMYSMSKEVLYSLKNGIDNEEHRAILQKRVSKHTRKKSTGIYPADMCEVTHA